jgi:hypothetical protein
MATYSTCDKPTDIDISVDTITERCRGLWSDLCQRCRLKEVRNLWESFIDWTQLLRQNVAHICGQIDCSPSYVGPIDPETKPLVPVLIKLHRYGLLTCDSQPFEDSFGFFNGAWCQAKQRPFLWFLIPTLHPSFPVEKADLFISALFAHPSLRAKVFSVTDQYSKNADAVASRRVVPLGGTSLSQTYHFRTRMQGLAGQVVSLDTVRQRHVRRFTCSFGRTIRHLTGATRLSLRVVLHADVIEGGIISTLRRR